MVAVIIFELVIQWVGDRHAEKLATTSELLRTMAIAKEAVIADAMKALGLDMQQKAADELMRRDGLDLLPIAVPIVLPAEANRAALYVEQAIVGEGDAVIKASGGQPRSPKPTRCRFCGGTGSSSSRRASRLGHHAKPLPEPGPRRRLACSSAARDHPPVGV
jgi:hypothetical protein